ncbi:hypothetical protein [Paracoccus aminophilus]|uniref:Type III secretion system protein n=1 Tax=Paracoccus aminophilus JCM 7686 TaxID=1367847 RepID=S5XNH9_PARAH|nr:hypothetical protein [Paracoccus aminophilus]AGT08884.1 type III secretion system protein [Paracoccus aminophilus JCM 7686]
MTLPALIDRTEMKLLIEAGYSGVLRGIDADLTPIFAAVSLWMPDYAAGEIGLALQELRGGDLGAAEARLLAVLGSGRDGCNEAQAILGVCQSLKALQDPAQAVEPA